MSFARISALYVPALLASLLLVGACDNSSAPTPTLTTLSVTLGTTAVQVGGSTTAFANGVDQNGAAIDVGAVTWSSSSSAVASVSASGQIAALAAGTTQIVANANGKTAQATLTVSAVPAVLSTVSVNTPLSSITFGQTTTATAAGLDQYNAAIATGTVVWSSSVPTVASVDAATGVVTGLNAGTTTIAAIAGSKVGTRVVTVTAPPALVINEVESNAGTPGDWIEIYNPTNAAVDISGWGFLDNDLTHAVARVPNGTTIPAGGYYVAEEAFLVFGLGAADDARLYNPFGVLVDKYSWTTHATTTYGRCANGSGTFVTMTVTTKGAANDCRPNIRINEVESSGGTPGDWIELYNAGAVAVNLSGFIVKDDDDTRTTTIAAGTVMQPGAFLVLEESFLGFGLGSADAARLFDPTGMLIDSYNWTAHAAVTYGRCPDGTGAMVNTAVSTKGAANNCTIVGPVDSPWPGADNVATVDGTSVFGGNMSGLTYEAAGAGRPNILWAARNGPGTIFRLIFSGGIWTPDPANNWSVGKALRYTDNTGDPDAEGITFAGGGSSAGLYVATERNNGNNAVSRNSILRFDPTAVGSTLTATHEWNLTSDLPATGANLGIEAITWIPDSMLVANGFFDENKNRVYAPADYADHAGGLFFVGVEANGVIYAYALNHTNSTFTRIATIVTGFPGVMGMEYDRESGYLWATCDDGCGGVAGVLTIDTGVGSSTRGRFLAPRRYARPTSMPNLNNEGFAFVTNAECSANRKTVFWSDDSETGGHALRTASIPCGSFAPLIQGIRALTTRP